MRYLLLIPAVTLGLTFSPTDATAKAGFLPGEAQAEAGVITKTKAELQADRQRRIELREARRELRRLKRLERARPASK